jgi:ATP-dependent Lhr-like helicase
MSVFARFPPRLQEAIVSRLGWTALRPVQEMAAEAILDGKNAVVLAPTAGGKTEAAIFPLLARLMAEPCEAVGLLYIAPLKALLNNQNDRLGTYAEMVGLRRFLWHGDVKPSRKTAFQREPAELLMTTPESLEVMLLSSRVAHPKLFQDLRAVVVDEIHAFAGTDRGAHLMAVLERLRLHARRDVQRVGLSATVGNPDAILQWLRGASRREGRIIDPPKTPTPKDIRVTLHESDLSMARQASQMAAGKKSLFFCQSRSVTERVAEHMRHFGTEVFVHHSSISTEERAAAESRFHAGEDVSIVCTSTLELGIDVGDLDRVLQADAPSTVSAFLQRLGRTGRRAGHRANTTFFCQDPETLLQAIAIVELAREGWVESVPGNRRCWPVLVHQLFALALQHGAISPERCWEILSPVPDFSGIAETEFAVLVDYLVEQEFLYLSAGLLSIGDQTERMYGKKNFLELYSVFTSPTHYTIRTKTGYLLGTLEQGFVDKLVEEMSSFLLGGRAWTVVLIQHEDRTVTVVPAPRGKQPSWGSFAPQILGFEICQKIREILFSDREIGYLDKIAGTILAEQRRSFQTDLEDGRTGLQIEDGKARWWTFAGGMINHTLKFGILLQQDCKIVADNLKLVIESPGLSPRAFADIVEHLAAESFWRAPGNREQILEWLPNYRLSKFQPALPPAFAAEMVAAFLIDIPGAIRFSRSEG